MMLFFKNDDKEIKIRGDNPQISGLVKRAPELLKIGAKYELN